MGAHYERGYMRPESNPLKRKRDELQTRRTQLFKAYERKPNDISLASEIKKLDDEIAECVEQMGKERRAGRKS
jgi:hypothetical protein